MRMSGGIGVTAHQLKYVLSHVLLNSVVTGRGSRKGKREKILNKSRLVY